jgi:hypothetical protein
MCVLLNPKLSGCFICPAWRASSPADLPSFYPVFTQFLPSLPPYSFRWASDLSIPSGANHQAHRGMLGDERGSDSRQVLSEIRKGKNTV